MLRDRMLADPSFLFKVGTEVSQMLAEDLALSMLFIDICYCLFVWLMMARESRC